METWLRHRGGRLALLAGLVLLAGCGRPAQQETAASAPPPGRTVTVIEREGLLVNYPCSQCHDKVAPELMELEGVQKHSEIKTVHFASATRCQMCHDPANMDDLTLLTLEPVSFNDAHEVCGQCHGEKMRDWKIGAHGKTVGGWMGTAQKQNCTHCHDAHAPGFAPVVALPPPPFPAGGITKGEHR